MRSTRMKTRLGEIDIEQRFRGGEFEEAAVLEEAVEALLAEFEEMIAQGLGGGVLAARERARTSASLPALRARARRPDRRCP